MTAKERLIEQITDKAAEYLCVLSPQALSDVDRESSTKIPGFRPALPLWEDLPAGDRDNHPTEFRHERADNLLKHLRDELEPLSVVELRDELKYFDSRLSVWDKLRLHSDVLRDILRV